MIFKVILYVFVYFRFMLFRLSSLDLINFNFFFYIFLDRENYDGVGDRYKLEGGRVGRDIGSW